MLSGCSLNESRVEYVTATPQESSLDTPLPTDSVEVAVIEQRDVDVIHGSLVEHIVRAGDTLSAIAMANNTTVETLLQVNQLNNADIISVGQVIKLPPPPEAQTPNFKLLADGQFVRGRSGAAFDVAAFITQQSGYIRVASDQVTTRQANGFGLDETLNTAEVVSRVSLEYSVDPRLLLALLEYRAQWLSNPIMPEAVQTHPMISEEDSGSIDREGLYRQLAWTANELNRGYYGWKYEGWSLLEFENGERLRFAPELNPATVGLQYFLHLNNSTSIWQRDISQEGFYRVYSTYFGSPIADTSDTLAGMGTQPQFTLPFASGETWFFTGGAHGGWGSGSAWAAVDFAPPDERNDNILCYTSDYFARAIAPGVIARSDGGSVILDLDYDGNESTGWTILYLHIASADRVPEGTTVQTGDIIGRPACEGGFSTATHMHIGRRYNGEWLPAYCHACPNNLLLQPFTMSGWSVIGLRNQEYQGYMEKAGERRIAEQGRISPVNRVSW